MSPRRHRIRPRPASVRVERAPYALPAGVPALESDPFVVRTRRLGAALALCALSAMAGFGVGRRTDLPVPTASHFLAEPDLLRDRLEDDAVRPAFEHLALDAIVRPGESSREFAEVLLAQLRRAGDPEELGALSAALRVRARPPR